MGLEVSSPSCSGALCALGQECWIGYEDQNDAASLRSDPLLKLVCGRLPEAADLASQPTLFRLENAVDAKACYRLAVALVQLWSSTCGRVGPR